MGFEQRLAATGNNMGIFNKWLLMSLNLGEIFYAIIVEKPPSPLEKWETCLVLLK